jgi:hypothetical protein
MHDIGRTQLETSWEAQRYGNGEYAGYEAEHEGYEAENGYETGFEYGYGTAPESYGGSTGEGPFSEAEEMELAAELLGVSNEAELDQFLGNVFRRAVSGLGAVIRSPVGQVLGGTLKNIARQALPVAGAALGNLIVPGAGGLVGGKLASAAGRMFGLELEGLSPEDQEFEVARRYVRLAGEAARQAAMAPPQAPPQAVVQRAIAAAAQQYAPGLVAGGRPGRRSGVWRRMGRTIVLYGV